MSNDASQAEPLRADVVVVGGGNAGFSAAHAAREQGAEVILVEKAPRSHAGGNTYFTAGAFRVAIESLDDVRDLIEGVDEEVLDRTVLPPYPASEFEADIQRLAGGQSDPVLVHKVATSSLETVHWLHGKGLRWTLLYPRQSYERDGQYVFWGGLYLGSYDGGKGLTQQHTQAAEAAGVTVLYEHALVDLHFDVAGRVVGIQASTDQGQRRIDAGAVVLASGGFEANSRLRASYLGAGWDLARVRGTQFNTGEGLELALERGADSAGNWSGCHAVAWDAEADSDAGDRELTNLLTKQSYPVGVVVNRDGERFIDEGADFRNFTYAKYGREILKQPGGIAFQLFDARTHPMLREGEYDEGQATQFHADSLEDLAELAGIDPEGLVETIGRFNAAIDRSKDFNPTVKDGRAATGLTPVKSNWAMPLEEPPYHAFPVRCGITFTFGGLRITEDAQVLDTSRRSIPGLYAAGELVGGLFYDNYPGGSGLMAGAVLGRAAGEHAGATVASPAT